MVKKRKIKVVKYRKGKYRLESEKGFFDSPFITKKEATSFYNRNKRFVEKNTY